MKASVRAARARTAGHPRRCRPAAAPRRGCSRRACHAGRPGALGCAEIGMPHPSVLRCWRTRWKLACKQMIVSECPPRAVCCESVRGRRLSAGSSETRRSSGDVRPRDRERQPRRRAVSPYRCAASDRRLPGAGDRAPAEARERGPREPSTEVRSTPRRSARWPATHDRPRLRRPSTTPLWSGSRSTHPPSSECGVLTRPRHNSVATASAWSMARRFSLDPSRAMAARALNTLTVINDHSEGETIWVLK